MTQVLFQPQKRKFADVIKSINSFKGKERPGEESAKAIFYRYTFTYNVTQNKGWIQLEIYFLYMIHKLSTIRWKTTGVWTDYGHCNCPTESEQPYIFI